MGKGYLSALFDISFNSLVTTRIVQFLYLVALVMTALFVLWLATLAFGSSTAAGVTFLIVSPIVFVLCATFARVYLETVIVLFKIAEHAAAIARNTEARETANP
jgi:hypothetical protein